MGISGLNSISLIYVMYVTVYQLCDVRKKLSQDKSDLFFITSTHMHENDQEVFVFECQAAVTSVCHK